MPRDEEMGRVGAFDAEAILRGVTERSPIGVYVLRHGRVIYANPRFTEMFGRTYEEIMDLPSVADLAVEAERPRIMAQVARREARDESIHYTTTALRKDGSTFAVDIFGGSIVVGGERLAFGTIIDVTDRQHAERALEFERGRLATVFEQAPAFLCVLRGPQHVFELANEAYYEVIGRRREIIGKPIAEALPEVVDQDFLSLLDRVLETGELYVGREVRALLARTPTGDQDERFVDFIFRPLVEEDGSRSGILVHGVDVTDRVRATAALQASERRARAQFKSLPVPAYAWQLVDAGDGEKDLVLVDYNDSALELSEGQVAKILGTRASKLYADRPEIARDIHEALGGAKIRREMDYRYIGGTVRRLVVTYAPAPPDMVLVHTEDVTDKVRLAEQLNQSQKMEAIGRLAGGIAHDFNNLLTVITTCATFLSESLAGQTEELQDVENIREAANQAAMLTKQLLAFSRRQLLVPTTLDLNDVTRSLAPMIRRLIGEDLRVVVETAPKLAPVKADRGQIEQVVMNLVVNARDAMPNGGTITIATYDVTIDEQRASRLGVDPGGYAVIAVHDTGVGMHPTIAARVFEPFFTTKETGRGTGLGLSTAYGIARQSGGFMSVESKVGSGSKFELGLRHLEDATLARPSDGGANAIAREVGTLLLVEDEPAVRAVTKRLLERMGFVVVDASNGRAALEVLERGEHRFDLIITDVVMPELGGRALEARVRAVHPTLPLLFMTGYTDDEILRRGNGDEHGSRITHVLPKPFTTDELAEAVRRALGRTTITER